MYRQLVMHLRLEGFTDVNRCPQRESRERTVRALLLPMRKCPQQEVKRLGPLFKLLPSCQASSTFMPPRHLEGVCVHRNDVVVV